MATKGAKTAKKAKKAAKAAKAAKTTKAVTGPKRAGSARPATAAGKIAKAAKSVRTAKTPTAAPAAGGGRAPSLAALERGLPAFQQASRHRYGSVREILAAARRSKPVADSLQRTAGVTPDQLERLLDRHFLDIRRLDGALRTARESR